MSDAPPPAAAPSRVVRATRAVALASVLALVALGLAWELALAPLRPGGSWWVLKVLPLVVPLGGLARLRLYTYRWVSLLVWPYFAEGVVRGASEAAPSATLAVAQAALALLLFGACVVHVRVRLRGDRLNAPVPGPPPPAASR